MAFRLEKNEPIESGLKDVLGRQLNGAVDRLEESPLSNRAVHEARLRIKKSRAILQLVRKDVRGLRKKTDRRLRDSGRLLSQMRDARAMVVTARGLCRQHDRDLTAAACDLVQPQLADRAERAARDNKRTIRDAVKTLRSVKRSVKRLHLDLPGAAVVQRGVRRAYERAQLDMERARRSNRPLAFHEWRKRVKTLWYQLRLLSGRSPRFRRQLAALKRLETELGREHNLQVLRTNVARRRSLPARQTVARLITLADKRQQQLRRDTLQLGAKVFADTPGDFIRRLFRPPPRRRGAST